MSLKTELQAAIAYCNEKLTNKGAETASTVYGIGDKIETIETGGTQVDYLSLYLTNAEVDTYEDHDTTQMVENGLENWKKLKSVVFHELKTVPKYAFLYCTSLTTAQFDKATRFNDYAFQACSSLNTLIIRTNSVAILGNRTFFQTPLMATSGEKGKIYVPQSLVLNYQSASGWSGLHADFYAIEGSEFE